MFSWTTPPCPYYGTCGGCQLQHLPTAEYEKHKLSGAQEKLDHFDITTPMDPLIRLDPGQRRRVSFKVEHGKIGFYAPKSHRLVPIDHCLLLTPKLDALLLSLAEIFKHCPDLPPKFTLTALDAANGVDVLLEGVDFTQLGYETLQSLSEIKAIGLRCLYKSTTELIFEKETPYLLYAGYKVPVRAGDFCQVTQETDKFFERVLCHPELDSGSQLSCPGILNQVQDDNDGVQTYSPIKQADLFAGRGTLSLPMLSSGPVDAFEMEGGAVATLQKFPVNAIKRQLFKNPLSTQECNEYDRIVINPPREGAIHQARQLADSAVKQIFYISCNPASFARDAAILIKGGYKVNKIFPFDQFIWSNHLELIGMFEKSNDTSLT